MQLVRKYLFPMLYGKKTIFSMSLGAVIGCYSHAFAFDIPDHAKGFLAPAGPVSALQLHHFWVVIGIMLLVLVPIFVTVPIIIWRYRRGGPGAYRPKWEFNSTIETLIWGVPLVIVGFLAVVLWGYTTRLDPYKPLGEDALRIEVVSLDWKFIFLYPDYNIAAIDYLALPYNRPITLYLTSGTVMQSFTIPRLSGQIYTMAGMQTQQNLMADQIGELVGRNTQYNGNGFAKQSFTANVLTVPDFEAWLAEKKTSPETLDWQNYQVLTQPSLEQPKFYGSVEDELFKKIIASFAPNMVGADEDFTSEGPQRHQHPLHGNHTHVHGGIR